ncbi:hypothetical protein [Hoyosella altamirensis]|uniref:hypothetical protein n=1 Tax=Hoyosella altamirensis TaxID=616997 RepID=UPI001E5F8D0A|nr:hypothetical protein [Hoyosella altamirensis]
MPGPLLLYRVGEDGLIYRSENAGESWLPTGQNGSFRSGPLAVVARRPDLQDFFVVGKDEHIWTTWWNPNGDPAHGGWNPHLAGFRLRGRLRLKGASQGSCWARSWRVRIVQF